MQGKKRRWNELPPRVTAGLHDQPIVHAALAEDLEGNVRRTSPDSDDPISVDTFITKYL